MIHDECGEVGFMRIGRELKYLEKTCPHAILLTKNPT
jgi:hypothetical protein